MLIDMCYYESINSNFRGNELMYGELYGKVVVVIGVVMGLGLFIILCYILEGMNVVVDYVGELFKEFEDV